MSSDIRAFNITRAMSTLDQNEDLVLARPERRSRFMFFFGNNTTARRPFWTLTSLVVSAFLPSDVALKGASRDTEKGYKGVVKKFQENWRDLGMSNAVNVRKNTGDKTFSVLVPIHCISGEGGLRNAALFAGLDPEVQLSNGPRAGEFPIADIAPRGNLTQKEIQQWASANAKLRVVDANGTWLCFIEYTVTKEEAEHLTNEVFERIKPMDLYGVVYLWVSSYYGTTGRSPNFSIPLRQIARSVTEATRSIPVAPRTNKDNLLTDEHGELFYIPSELDDINRFEDLYSAHYMAESGVFGPVDLLSGGAFVKPKPAPNPMPVYVDWLNLKFAYTNGSGRLSVMSLDRSYASNATHYFRLLNSKVESQKYLLDQLNGLGIFYNVASVSRGELLTAVAKAAKDAEGLEVTDLKLIDLMNYATKMFGAEVPEAMTFRKCVDAVLQKLEASPEVAYARYSVPTILSMRASLRVMRDNWTRYEALKDEDKALRKAYIDQGVDPNYQLPAVPYVAEGRGLLPHQFKTLNMSKASPANVLYPVAAGGGKCLEGSTLVNTNHGLLTLAEIHDTFAGEVSKTDARFKRVSTDLQVKSLRGYEDVTHVFKRRGQLWETRLDNGTRFKGLKEHKFWTQRGWVETKDLTTEDWVAAPTNVNLFGSLTHVPTELLLLDFEPSFNTRLDCQEEIQHLQALYSKKGLVVGKDLGLVLGALVAEGGGVQFHNTDQEFVNLYIDSFRNVFGCEPIVRTSEVPRAPGRKQLFTVQPSNQYVSLVLSGILNDGEPERLYSHEKKVPLVVRQANKQTQRAFLQAWFEGDGTVAGIDSDYTTYKVSGCTISQTLAVQVANMLRNFGVAVRSGHRENPRTWETTQGGRGEIVTKTAYGVSVETASLSAFRREVGFLCSRKTNYLDKCVRRQTLAETTKQGAINLQAQGRSQRVPLNVVSEVVLQIESELSNFQYETSYSSVRNGTEFSSTLVANHSIATAQRYHNQQSANRLKINLGQLNKGQQKGHTSKHLAKNVLQFAQKHPMLKKLRRTEKFAKAIQFLKASLNSNWTRVVSVVDTKVKDFVYDLSVPGSHSYVANGHYTHNTMIYATDLLREMGEFKTPGPYAVMCPAHLVAQYVKEFVYATDGRVNCVPITSYTVRRHGLERLRAMVMASPVNSILIVDYNVITLRNKTIAYGTEVTRIFPIVEFLRQFGIQVVYSDETHYLKSESSRQQAAHRLIADIPKKRGASGTFVQDTIKDLVKQAALFDPTIFGTMEDFVDKYALETRGTKVLAWKPGTESLVKQIMRENFIYAEAKRKEWAAILPKPVEAFHKVSLTPNQLNVYNQILNQVVEQLRAEIEKNQTLRDLLTPSEDGSDDDSKDVTIDQLLKPYLARLERFITAPGKDTLGAAVLQGPDLMSPKVAKIVQLAMDHVNEGVPGKVLIFTNYTLSAEAIYESFPESFRSQVILYTAGEKEACGAQFEKDPSKTVMVGVEQSMNTGLNLQFASRLIRTETVWTPGVLEQGNARIGRPNIKVAEERTEIYYDWIIANMTIDVTKISYLMAKTISAAKYEEAGNPRFDELEVPPLFSMTLDTVLEANDFDTTMLDYYDKYEAYRHATFAEFAEFREKNKGVLFTEDGKLKMVPIVRGPNLPDSKLLRRVPYVPGTELYAADQLGLVRYDAYMRLSLEEESDEESDEEGDDDNSVTNELEAEAAKAVGLAVHTDRGDGEITRIGKKRVTVLLPSGERVSVNKMTAFVITRKDTSNKDIRTHLLKMVGDVPLDAPIDVLESQVTDSMRRKLERQAQREQRQAEKVVKEYRIKPGVGEDDEGNEVRVFNVIDQEDNIVETFYSRREARQWIETPDEDGEDAEDGVVLDISFTVVNDMLGMRVDNVGDDDRIADTAQQYGFRYSPEYLAAPIQTPAHMLRLFKAWAEAGYTIPKENNEVCKAVYARLMSKGRKSLPNTFGFTSQLELKNFYLHEFKPNPKDDMLMPYPMVQEGVLYVALPLRAHPASMKAVRSVKVPGVRWAKYEASAELVLFTRTKERANQVIRKMLDEGVKFANLDAMRKQFKSLKVVKDHE